MDSSVAPSRTIVRRDIGLDPDDDGLGAAQPGDLRDGAEGVAGEGVDDVQGARRR